MFHCCKSAVFLGVLLFLLMTACRKPDALPPAYVSGFKVQQLSVPGGVTLDVYMGDTYIDSMPAASNLGSTKPLSVAVDAPTRISLKTKGTDEVVLDTVVTGVAGKDMILYVAYSPLLGLNEFISGNSSGIAADSALVSIVNEFPDVLLPEDVSVDAILFKTNASTGALEETGISWSDLKKNKLHPDWIKLQVSDNGVPVSYIVRLKNTTTGEYVADSYWVDMWAPTLTGGRRQFIRLQSLDFGDGTYFMIADTILL